MAGRHRRPPAWRRLLLRLRGSDRAARLAALQVELEVLRATVAELRTELGAARAQNAAQAQAHALALAAATPPVITLDPAARRIPVRGPALEPVVEPVLQPVASAASMDIDLGDSREIAIMLAALPEAGLLDPRKSRDDDVADPAATIDLNRESAERRTA